MKNGIAAWRNTTSFGKAKEEAESHGWELSDDEIWENYVALAEMSKSREMCNNCQGRETCQSNFPGMQLEGELVGKRVQLTYKPCTLDIEYRSRLKIERLLTSSRIPPALREKTFDNFEVNDYNRAAFEAAQRVAYGLSEKGLLLAGPTGTGKTHLAAAIMNTRVQYGLPTVFVVVPELLNDIRTAIGKGVETTELMDTVQEAECLVLDDLGTEKMTEWVAEQLFVLINARLLNRKLTIITANFDRIADMAARIGGIAGQRIVSRLAEMCDWVRLEGPDRRFAAASRNCTVTDCT